jgi:hypothetical protein
MAEAIVTRDKAAMSVGLERFMLNLDARKAPRAAFVTE